MLARGGAANGPEGYFWFKGMLTLSPMQINSTATSVCQLTKRWHWNDTLWKDPSKLLPQGKVVRIDLHIENLGKCPPMVHLLPRVAEGSISTHAKDVYQVTKSPFGFDFKHGETLGSTKLAWITSVSHKESSEGLFCYFFKHC